MKRVLMMALAVGVADAAEASACHRQRAARVQKGQAVCVAVTAPVAAPPVVTTVPRPMPGPPVVYTVPLAAPAAKDCPNGRCPYQR